MPQRHPWPRCAAHAWLSWRAHRSCGMQLGGNICINKHLWSVGVLSLQYDCKLGTIPKAPWLVITFNNSPWWWVRMVTKNCHCCSPPGICTEVTTGATQASGWPGSNRTGTSSGNISPAPYHNILSNQSWIKPSAKVHLKPPALVLCQYVEKQKQKKDSNQIMPSVMCMPSGFCVPFPETKFPFPTTC